jgi:cytochrome b pre-mRNA-processing protein 3
MPFGKKFRRDPTAERARRLYEQVILQARQPALYRTLGVPDSLDGRFEMITLHLFMVLHRFKQSGQADADVLGQALCNIMFADMDVSLREMGAGDLGVGGRVKRMASGFMGRVVAYSSGLAATPELLGQALRRNVYGTTDADDRIVAAMARYVRESVARLARQSEESITAGRLDFALISDSEGPDTGH